RQRTPQVRLDRDDKDGEGVSLKSPPAATGGLDTANAAHPPRGGGRPRGGWARAIITPQAPMPRPGAPGERFFTENSFRGNRHCNKETRLWDTTLTSPGCLLMWIVGGRGRGAPRGQCHHRGGAAPLKPTAAVTAFPAGPRSPAPPYNFTQPPPGGRPPGPRPPRPRLRGSTSPQ